MRSKHWRQYVASEEKSRVNPFHQHHASILSSSVNIQFRSSGSLAVIPTGVHPESAESHSSSMFVWDQDMLATFQSKTQRECESGLKAHKKRKKNKHQVMSFFHRSSFLLLSGSCAPKIKTRLPPLRCGHLTGHKGNRTRCFSSASAITRLSPGSSNQDKQWDTSCLSATPRSCFSRG